MVNMGASRLVEPMSDHPRVGTDTLTAARVWGEREVGGRKNSLNGGPGSWDVDGGRYLT